jgi:glycosyltransferase involved in cell wall biosynthesis
MILNYYNDLVFQPSELFLNKDFGQVATVLGRLYGQRVTHLICCNEPDPSLSRFMDNEVVQARKRLRFLPARLDVLKNRAVDRFLERRRGEFSLLVIFPFQPLSDLRVVRRFRALNPGARIVLKLDANRAYLDRLQQSYFAKPRSRIRQHAAYRRLLELADLVIHETRDAGELLRSGEFLGTRLPPGRFLNVYNGLSQRQVEAAGGRLDDDAPRGNVIVFSGRLGTLEKNVELIFRSDPVPPGWKLKFIGPIDDVFATVVARYRAADANFDAKYQFTGAIADKARYFRELSQGKILLLCSNKEGFPMVYAEAHYFGLYIVTTAVSGAAEATDDGRHGRIFPCNDPAALRDALHAVCNDPALEDARRAARKYGARHFLWEDSLRHPAIERLFKPTRREQGR